MDFVNLKIEKANAIKRFNHLRTITTLFRLIEILFVFILLSRFSVQIPVKLSLSGEYFRQLYSAVFSPSFVFIIGNAIVVTLFLKSERVSNPNQLPAHLCKDYTEEKVREIQVSKIQSRTSAECATVRHMNVIELPKDTQNFKTARGMKHEKEKKMMGRSKSGELRRTSMPHRELRRSTTELRHGNVVAAEEMSGEDFRRRVEDFIARQQRSLREDEFSALVRYP